MTTLILRPLVLVRALVGLLVLAPPLVAAGPEECVDRWTRTFGGVAGLLTGSVQCSVEFDDGRGPALIVGGGFLYANGVLVNRVARWDGSAWSALGSGFDGTVNDLLVHDDGSGDGPQLYACGAFTHSGDTVVNRVARWNGTAWEPLGSGFNETAYALASFEGAAGGGPLLYVGGDFSALGAPPSPQYYGIARWDGKAWGQLASEGGLGGILETVRTLQPFVDHDGPQLFVGGCFGTVLNNGTSLFLKHLVRFDGEQFTSAGANFDLCVYALQVHDDGGPEGPALIAGGAFTAYDSVPALRVACYRPGSGWSPMGPGLGGEVLALGSADLGDGPALYAGGTFQTSGGAAAPRLARWNGAAWSAVGGGCDSGVLALAPLETPEGPRLLVGGAFDVVGSMTAHRLAAWSGEAWSTIGDELDGAVVTVTRFDDGIAGSALHIGGSFTAFGSTALNRVARWQEGAWQPLGDGFDGTVSILAPVDSPLVGGSRLLAGGAFAHAGATPVSRLAAWDGTTWSEFAGGANDLVRALLFDPDAGGGPEDASSAPIFVGGSFTNIGGLAVSRIARYDSSGWNALAGGVGGGASPTVRSMVFFDDGQGGGPNLHVGGAFTQAGAGVDAVAVSNIARFDGERWFDVGGGVNGVVYAMAVFDSGGGPALHVAGTFAQAGGAPAPRIARWNGTSWTPLATSVNGFIFAMAVANEDDGPETIYVGGTFTNISGTSAARVARWRDGAWSKLDTGLVLVPGLPAPSASALFVDPLAGPGRSVVVGGSFRLSPAGDAPLARWEECPVDPPPIFGDLDGDGFVGGSDLGILLASWGGRGPADLNGDGVVDGTDLGLLLANWQPGPP